MRSLLSNYRCVKHKCRIAQESNGFGSDVAGTYNFALRDFIKFEDGVNPEVDTYGADLSAVYAINKNHSVNLRFG